MRSFAAGTLDAVTLASAQFKPKERSTMSPLVVFAICIVSAIGVGVLRSLELAKPLSARARAPEPTRLAPKRVAVAPARPVASELEHPEAA